MKSDMKETMMLMAKNDMNEFEKLQESTVENFLIRYKVTIEEQVNNGK